MEYRQLGRSGLRVSVLSLGTLTFGGTGHFAKAGNADEKSAREMVDIAIDAGVNCFNTADVYSDGLSEEILGKVLKGRRHNVLLATKARFSTGPGPNDEGLSRHHLITACEASLKRLGTDYIDLYELHEWDGFTPVEETAAALEDLVRTGKVRYTAVSNFSGWQLMKLLQACRTSPSRPVAQEIHYTLQSREAEYELVPVSLDQGIGIMVWSPLAGGLLTGKFRRGHAAPETSRQLQNWGEPPVHDEEKLYDIVEVVCSIAAEHHVSPAEVALAWLLGRPGVSSLVIGARTRQQLESNLKAALLVLREENFTRLNDVSLPPLIYPYWHQCRWAKGRLSAAEVSLIGQYKTLS